MISQAKQSTCHSSHQGGGNHPYPQDVTVSGCFAQCAHMLLIDRWLYTNGFLTWFVMSRKKNDHCLFYIPSLFIYGNLCLLRQYILARLCLFESTTLLKELRKQMVKALKQQREAFGSILWKTSMAGYEFWVQNYVLSISLLYMTQKGEENTHPP